MTLILSGTDGLSDVDGSAATPAIRGTDTNTGIFFPAADTIAFSEGGVESMRIDSSGNLGIGTSSPERSLDIRRSSTAGEIGAFINNTAGSTAGNTSSLWFGTWAGAATTNIYNAKISAVNTDTGSAASALTFWTYNGSGSSGGVTERARIDSSGNLLVGTTTSRGAATFAQGIFPLTNNGYNLGSSTYRWSVIYLANSPDVSSDRRLKTDIQDSDLGLEFVKSLRPVKYKLKVGQYVTRKDKNGNNLYDETGEPILDERVGVRHHYGFIAQEVKQALGEKDAAFWKLEDKDNPESNQALSYEQLISPLVKAIQEQQAIIQSLTARIEALEGK